MPHDAELARWLLELVDASPDRLGIVEVTIDDSSRDDEVEQRFRDAFEFARQDRPHLVVQVLPGRSMRRSVLVALHEHEWVGGECVRGCASRYEEATGDA